MIANISTILFILATILTIPVLCTKKLYEQKCSTSVDCNQDLGLSCQNKACKCAPNGETVYSVSINRCVGAAGRECHLINNSSLCVENSICRDYEYMHLCTCKDGFYQSKDGNCYTIAKYGGSCLEEEFSCGDTVSTSISCVEKKCRCLLGEENQYYDPRENKCISHAGGQCLYHYSKPCTKNSFCGEINENIHGVSFVVGHKCLCNAGYSYARNRQCFARYGTDCSVNNPCNYDEFLGCLNGKCQCRNPLNEEYSQRTRQCAILVGSTCKPDEGSKCIDNAECLSETNNSTKLRQGKCQCSTGYSVTPLNTCLLDINQKCEPNQCNYHNALTCINGTCNCIDSYLSYDKVSKSCVSLVGLPCGTVSLFEDGIPPEKKTEITVLCEANASCSKVSSSGPPNGAAKRYCKSGSSSKN